MNKFTRILAFLLLVISFATNAQMTATKTTFGGVGTVLYRMHNFDSTKQYPVVLYMHGSGQMITSGNQPNLDLIINCGDQQNLLNAGDTMGFVVVAPQLVQANNNWVPGWSESYVTPVVNAIFKLKYFDSSRFYVTGLSLGGGGVWEAVKSAYGKRISAAIAICGTPQDPQGFNNVALDSIPIQAYHAKDDQTIGYIASVNAVNSINIFKPIPLASLILYSTGGHGIWGRVYGDPTTYTWMLSQKRNYGPPPPPVKTVTSTVEDVNAGTITVFFSDGTSLLAKKVTNDILHRVFIFLLNDNSTVTVNY